ncbi:MAG: DNA-directed RNA polymerase subunit omega, partial [Planctomycetota bacterium]
MRMADIIEAAEKVGGSFKLTALLQKRVVELMRGAPPLVDESDRRDLIHIALQEVLQEKICLVPDVDEETL